MPFYKGLESVCFFIYLLNKPVWYSSMHTYTVVCIEIHTVHLFLIFVFLTIKIYTNVRFYYISV